MPTGRRTRTTQPLGSTRQTLTRVISSAELTGFLQMFLSNVVGGLCFSYMASGRWNALDSQAILFTISYTQWINLGVTFAKLGLDTHLFAIVSSDPETRLLLWPFLLRYSAPISIVTAIALIPVFGTIQSLLLAIIVFSEATSVLTAAQMTALRIYSFPAIGSLLKYPLFFILLAVLSIAGPLRTTTVTFVLCLGSLIRWGYLATRSIPQGSTHIWYKPTLWIALSHPLNLVLFKLDQLMLPVFPVRSGAIALSEYAYLTKWPELISGVLTTAGTVYFPNLYSQVLKLKYSIFSHRLTQTGLAVCLIVIASGTLVYARAFKNPISFSLLPGFFLSSALILPVNLGTYILLRHSRLQALIRNLALSNLIGLLVWISVARLESPVGLSYVVPSQLFVFATLFLLRRWGTRSETYGHV